MRVLVACEFSGIVREAFKARGHDAWSCDILPTERPGQHIVNDVRNVFDWDWDLMIAHPPCFRLTPRGQYRGNEHEKRQAEQFFMDMINAPIERICVENSVGVMSTLYRKPDQIINPFEFGHPERKRTCLWLKNLPVLQPRNIVAPEPPSYIDRSGQRRYWLDALSQSDERWKIRSRTFEGIAAAMASQWDTILLPPVQMPLLMAV